MLKRIDLGLIFALLSTIYYVVMLACRESFNLNKTSYKAFIVPHANFAWDYFCLNFFQHH